MWVSLAELVNEVQLSKILIGHSLRLFGSEQNEHELFHGCFGFRKYYYYSLMQI